MTEKKNKIRYVTIEKRNEEEQKERDQEDRRIEEEELRIQTIVKNEEEERKRQEEKIKIERADQSSLGESNPISLKNEKYREKIKQFAKLRSTAFKLVNNFK
jgi:hypothetical protein